MDNWLRMRELKKSQVKYIVRKNWRTQQVRIVKKRKAGRSALPNEQGVFVNYPSLWENAL